MTKYTRQILVAEFAAVINRNSAENDSNTPDFVLAEYLVNCLESFNDGVNTRKRFWEVTSEHTVSREDYDK